MIGFGCIAVCSHFCEGESWPERHDSVIRILVTLDRLFHFTENQCFSRFAEWDAQRQALKITCYTSNSSSVLIFSLVLRPFAAEGKNVGCMLFFHSSHFLKTIIIFLGSLSEQKVSVMILCVWWHNTDVSSPGVTNKNWIFPGQDRISAHSSQSVCTGEAS